jgi:hypothetical protein
MLYLWMTRTGDEKVKRTAAKPPKLNKGYNNNTPLHNDIGHPSTHSFPWKYEAGKDPDKIHDPQQPTQDMTTTPP